MDIKFMDLVEVAEDDVTRWFGHCETGRECDDLARVMMESVKAEADVRASAIASLGSSEGGGEEGGVNR